MMRILWVGLFATLLSAPAGGQDGPSTADLVKALRAGGHVIVFRHGATHADQADTDPLHPENVAQQRQLNDKGRADARAIGEALRRLQIPVGRVVTSVFNRAVETGKLIGGADVLPSPDVTEAGWWSPRPRTTAAPRRCASSPPPCRPPAPTWSSSPISRTSSTPSARTGSRCARARRACSSPTATAFAWWRVCRPTNGRSSRRMGANKRRVLRCFHLSPLAGRGRRAKRVG